MNQTALRTIKNIVGLSEMIWHIIFATAPAMSWFSKISESLTQRTSPGKILLIASTTKQVSELACGFSIYSIPLKIPVA